MYRLDDTALEAVAAASFSKLPGCADEILAGGVSSAAMGAAIGSFVLVIGVVPAAVFMFNIGISVMLWGILLE